MPAPFERILFVAASSLADPEEREQLLDRACGGDVELRSKLDRIFTLQSEAANFFEAAPELPVSDRDPEHESSIGGRIGRYRLIERIGEGGCGVVYLAEQCEPVRRKVALKIIRLGMDTESVIARFELERQSLAMMDHPNIARVLDAGATASGRPYFVMELVDGERITNFCDAARFGIRQRLDIFVQVCQAIQHAHLKGVIHRDIKPSNILVRLQDDIVMPKVIDFGIAKAAARTADDDVTLTAVDQMIGTPAYMSPEIAAGGTDLDTRTDIHSLGAVLYELITGRAPFDPKRLQGLDMAEIRRILRDEDPPRPSVLLASLDDAESERIAAFRHTDRAKLIHQVKGDLDWIVAKAMNRDRDQRYQTVNALASDIERHLRNEPVSAGPPDRLYLMAKWIRRNKISFLSGTAIVLALGAGFGTSTRLYLLEKEARAEQERLKIEATLARENEAGLRRNAEYRELAAQAAVRLSYKDFEAADRLLGQIPVEHAPPSLEAARSYSTVGEWHVLAGRWKEATDHFASAALALTTADPADSDALSIAFIPAAATLSQAGDRVRYDALRQTAIGRFKQTSNVIAAEQVVKSALLMPADQEVLSELEPLATLLKRAIDSGEGAFVGNPDRLAWTEFALALLDYRRGDYAVAGGWATRYEAIRGRNLPRDASLDCLTAMIAWKSGRREDAVIRLQAGRKAIDAVFAQKMNLGNANSFWFDWVNARILCREAISLIEG
jgi:serine/threonine protein kinase